MTSVMRVEPTDAPVQASDGSATLPRTNAPTVRGSVSLHRDHVHTGLLVVLDALDRDRGLLHQAAVRIERRASRSHGMRVPRHAHGDLNACNPSVSALNGISDAPIEKLVAFVGAPGLRISACTILSLA